MVDADLPLRLKDDPSADADGLRLKELFSTISAAPHPATARLERIAAQLESKVAPRPSPFSRPLALAGAIALGAAVLAGMLVGLLLRPSVAAAPAVAPPVSTSSPVVSPPPSVAAQAPSPSVLPLPVASPPSSPTRSKVVAVAAHPPARPEPALTPAKPVPVPASPAVGGLAASESEAVILGRALHALREESNPALALTLLDGYLQAFPDGELRPEARFAEIEALVAAGRTDDALNRLRPELIALLPRSTELLIVRGELLARSHRCPEALLSFAQAAERLPSNSALLDRIGVGREFCHSENEKERSP